MLLTFPKCTIHTQWDLNHFFYTFTFPFLRFFLFNIFVVRFLFLFQQQQQQHRSAKSNLGWRIGSFRPVNVQSDATDSVSVYPFLCYPSDIFPYTTVTRDAVVVFFLLRGLWSAMIDNCELWYHRGRWRNAINLYVTK